MNSVTTSQIVVVDDDTLFLESLEQNLRDVGYGVTSFDNGAAALDHLADDSSADLVLLDWKMPEMNGIALLRKLREAGKAVPVIFLTVLGDQIYEEAALSGGAVDFIEKSRSFSILRRRIDLILGGGRFASTEPAAETPPSGVMIGDLELRLDSNRARWRGDEVDLSLTEFRIVHMLATHGERDVSYRELYDLVHGEGFAAGEGEYGYRANVRTFVKRIRGKFRDCDATFDSIENYPGFGYRWRPDGG